MYRDPGFENETSNIPRNIRRGGGVSQHQDSSQVAAYFNPVRGVRDQMERAGIQPANHHKDNVKAIRQMSQTNRIKKQEDAKLEDEKARGPKARPAPKPALPQPNWDGESPDHISLNILTAASSRPPAKLEEAKEDPLRRRDYGRVPMYLQERKIEMAAERAIRAAQEEAAKIPAGMRVLPESERLETLSLLQRNRDEILREISSLPFVINTISMRKHKEGLEQRLREIEEAERVFGRPNILVRQFA